MAERTSDARVVRVAPQTRAPYACRVDIEGAGSYLLDAVTVHRLGLEAGAVLDAQALATVREAATRHEARAVAMRLLARRLRSRVELERVLRRRGIAPEVVRTVSLALRRDGWLDDERFARAWVRDRLALRPCGPRRLRADLVARGVAPDIAGRVITTLLPSSMEDDLAARQAQARLDRMNRLPPDIARRRLVAWLLRRGFGGETIARVLRRLTPAGPVNRDDDSAA